MSAFKTFRDRYPEGCVVSDLVTVHDGQYVVRTAIVSEGKTLATGFAANVDVQIAEDEARLRAIALLDIANIAPAAASSTPSEAPKLSVVQSASASIPSPASTQSHEKDETALALEASPPKPETNDEKVAEEDLGPPIDVIEESAEPVDESLEPAVSPAKVSAAMIAMESFDASANPVDLSDVIAQTDVELTRLGWTSAQGREYLEKTYGKRSRQQLTDEELMSFLLYLEDQ